MDQNERIRLLKQLCAIDSRTIEGAAGTVRVAEIIGEHLKTLEFGLEWLDLPPEDQPRGRHVKAVYNPGATPHLVLLAHVDTVLSPNDVPFRVDEEAEIVYGSGVCDMKGGCVILLDALGMALKEAAAVRDASLTVLLDCCEELSTPSFAEVARETARDATACLNFEPPGVTPDGEAQIVIGRKGVLRFDLTCSGRAAHSGNAHANGINAIRELARKVEQIESLTDYDAGLSANVGQIVGGHAANQVADKASMTFELRAFEAEALERLRAEARTICSRSTVRSSEDGATTRLELQEHFSYPAWPADKGTECLAKRYVELAKKHGVVVTPVQRGGGSDASHVADLVPTLDGLGILGGGMHAKTEWADLKSLAVGGRIVADLIADLCSNGCDCT